MTLVLNCLTKDWVVQVSDRRLTHGSGPRVGQVLDDEANKAVTVCNRLAFAYSGLGWIGGTRTDHWLLDVLSKVKPYNPLQCMFKVAGAAGQTFGQLRLEPALKRHAFVSVGWAIPTPELPIWPLCAVVSNAVDTEMRWTRTVEDGFAVRTRFLPPRWGYLAIAIGQYLTNDEWSALLRGMRRIAKRRAGPSAGVRLCADVIWRVSARTRLVGPSLMAVSIPRPPQGQLVSGLSIPLRFKFSRSEPTAMYLYPGLRRPIAFAPHMTCDGDSRADIWIRTEPRS